MNTHRYRGRLTVATLLVLVLLPATACGTSGPSTGTPGPTPSGQSMSGPASPPATRGQIKVTSTAFTDGSAIPARYSCRGSNQSPPLAWSGIGPDAVAVALVMDDPDAVGGRYVHWVVTDIPPDVRSSPAGRSPPGGRTSANSGGQARYLGPCPPSGSGVHHYRFTVYALSRLLRLTTGTPARTAQSAIAAATLGQGRLIGTYAAG